METTTGTKTKIYVQVWHSGAKYWDDCKPTLLEVSNAGETAQAIAKSTGQPVRMTYFKPSVPVGNLNGSYFHPSTI